MLHDVVRSREILIVDDNHGDVDLILEGFEQCPRSHLLTEAGDGVEALARLRGEGEHRGNALPDLVLLDLNLPRLNGHEVLAEIKRDAALRHIPVVVFTSSRAEADIARAYAIERKRIEDALLASEERVRQLAHHDVLTGLPNRRFLMARIDHALAYAKRHAGKLALMFIDLDRFKVINDSLGHDIGDLLLQEVAARLRASLRDEDTVARQGGDEFIALLAGLPHHMDAGAVAQKILESLAQPFSIAGHELEIGASIGISVNSGPDDSAALLLKHADIALYRAKDAGRRNYQFFTEEMHTAAVARLTLETELRRAMSRGELMLHYQTQTDLRSGALCGIEALVRWQHPVRGLILPAEFIPVAEECGLINALGEWVLYEACRQNKAWHDAGRPKLRVAVNLSVRQFNDKQNLVALVRRALAATGLAPHWLELEITETTLMQHTPDIQALLDELTELGVVVSIDDFGTGYSSLSYLTQYPVGKIKIDRSFVSGITPHAQDGGIAAAVIAMAQSLKITVLAEGVETAHQLAFLKAKGCDEAQGYLLSRPRASQDMGNAEAMGCAAWH